MGLFNSGVEVRNALYLYLAAAFPVMMTVFHFRTLLKKRGDYRAIMLYFAAFFTAFMALPVLGVLVTAPSPADFLRFVGLTPGHVGTGLLFAALGLPAALIVGFLGSRDPAMQAQYPFSKEACAGPRKFIRYEIAYFALYYLPWEFVFRGLLFFPLIPLVGLVPALAVQTIISTLYHFGHPPTEIFAAVGAGFIFGLIAYATGSIFTSALIHAEVGVATDAFLYFRRLRPAERV
jgi:membrane protease YdiL (CAAX protease family)